MKRADALGVLVAVSCAAIPGMAHADVLQIGASGAEWVAGGPASLPPPSDLAQIDPSSGVGFIGSTVAKAPEEVESTPLEVDSQLHPQSITDALDAAGPTRWRERVAQLAAKYDISPTLLEAVVWQESRWNELALSPVGARGLAQLMPGTAAQMGVDPGDPIANLEGGARYLRMQLDAFGGDIEKALAAYNAGPARVLKAGGVPNIRETRAYVASIMARLTAPVRQ
ncbi:lytic transglycosylase domain-containing protein [Novosphingobium guangzhouense]|uniref:Transglycosylase n=1 Tax=Novosphingobium guangzhouense TaxID=1850347 RepID=A0A2K2FSJ0_9SPHN|nr:lytic transglycosylase domain-containing protein [Novosphingobium guangzhouense]PNU01755.1 transglycosylase [Novosphingobium guangzhouense]